MRRVVITGMGIWSCIGESCSEVEQSLRSGKSGIGIDPLRTEYGYRSPLTGIVRRPSLKGILDRKQREFLAEEGEYAYMATKEAVENAGLDADMLEKCGAGIIYGNDSTAEAVIRGHERILEKKDTTLVGAASIFRSMNSTVTMNLSTIFRLKGINMTVSAACASGSHAIGLAAMLIRSGLQKVVIAGGAQETNYLSMASFDGISAFSMRTDEPARASRPFDRYRDGLVPSGGAASLVLEDYGHAVERGAVILAEVLGYGFSSNGGMISSASAEGSEKAMRMALDEAGLSPDRIDYVNAHATSTVQGDMYEAIAIDRLFGRYRTPVSSTKGMTGHECWMAGASETVYSILMMRGGFIAPNINFTEPDEYSAPLNIVADTAKADIRCFLSNSFGFGGTNSALVVGRAE
ncbi:beta-ketoacyl synthase [Muribaculum sp. An289]|jgi:3-oxoacyl-[acyl-carrier-protein] synthase-1|uniref:3-oxoacyl-[acyl-carrier-protein] synthase 1 n=1 Tax=Candidatus Merdivivens faecigallinarum TaxID=2840871 RepID=A0A9D9NQ18_9BACT|nr:MULTISPECIES: beta-ketoacyl-[acyl-carrier-protein] synthase family protein [unclassified Muribaculum]MBO8481565.1 beta-ketoacyl-[acyl-carrier-protein] synthase family protein [Candidatus Merdivivens faecigallinarum]OUO37496.1 beta-ketoacyl synthase [Muribaculum sp. An289]OUO43415.1 beta-ketoacyl synthase [Muribaculum sp. An287]